jgi:hypothetical protein
MKDVSGKESNLAGRYSHKVLATPWLVEVYPQDDECWEERSEGRREGDAASRAMGCGDPRTKSHEKFLQTHLHQHNKWGCHISILDVDNPSDGRAEDGLGDGVVDVLPFIWLVTGTVPKDLGSGGDDGICVLLSQIGPNVPLGLIAACQQRWSMLTGLLGYTVMRG